MLKVLIVQNTRTNKQAVLKGNVQFILRWIVHWDGSKEIKVQGVQTFKNVCQKANIYF